MTLRALSDADVGAFETDGIIGPFPLLAPEDLGQLIRDARTVDRRAAWYRGLHAFDTSLVALGRRPDVVAATTRLLGPDVLLWGCELAKRVPGVGHYWHSDVEARCGPTLNVWVGLEHLGPDTPFLAVPGSHRYGTMPQDLVPEDQPELRDDATLLELAHRFDPTAAVRNLLVAPGEVVLFNGDLWHGTRHHGDRLRKALVLVYCAADTPVRRPVTYVTPVEWHPDPQPCVLVAGSSATCPNPLIEPAPLAVGARAGGLVTALDERLHDLHHRFRKRADV